MTEQEYLRLLWKASWQSSGKAFNEGDKEYWLRQKGELEARAEELHDTNYVFNKMIGMGAMGVDLPAYGPFAQPPKPFYSPVPPYPDGEPKSYSGLYPGDGFVQETTMEIVQAYQSVNHAIDVGASVWIGRIMYDIGTGISPDEARHKHITYMKELLGAK